MSLVEKLKKLNENVFKCTRFFCKHFWEILDTYLPTTPLINLKNILNYVFKIMLMPTFLKL